MTGPKMLRIVDIAEPTREPGEVLVRLTRATICGSDLHEFRNRAPREFPWHPGSPGHECLGVVLGAEAGAGLGEGDTVLVRPKGGGLREIGVADPEYVIPVPDGLGPNEAVMAQLLGPVIHCCKRLPNLVGARVFIIGQGPAGLTLTNMVRRLGAGTIVTSDLVEHRRRTSIWRGADRSLPGDSEVLAKARALTGGRLFDLVIEAVGDQATLELATELARQEGTVMLFGLPGEDAPMYPRRFFSKQIHLTTTEYPDRVDLERALEMIASGHIEMDSMVTHVLPFGEVQRGFELADSREDEVLRVVLDLEA
jgi:L-iditol 2-dehydrogenase